jgi:hypothetical protein
MLNNIYPNPAAASFNYSLSVQEEQEVTVHLVNQYGQVLSGERLLLSSGINNFNMDVSSLSDGIYFLVASGDDHAINLTERIVVQH